MATDDHWAKARKQGHAARTRLIDGAPDDPLGRIAYLAAGLGPDADATDDAMHDAREMFTWEQITAAVGKSDVRHVRERHLRRMSKREGDTT
jgi:hypothetical protein